MLFRLAAILCFLLFCGPSTGNAVDRIAYEVTGTWRAIDVDGLDFDGRGFRFYFEVAVDATPGHSSSSSNIVGYEPHFASLHIDGVPVPLLHPHVLVIDSFVPGELDRLSLYGLEDVSPPQDRISVQNVIHFASDTLVGTAPQAFRTDQVHEFADVIYSPEPNCFPGDLCLGGAPEFNYRIENGIAVGVLVPEPASILHAFAFFALLMIARSRSDKRPSSI